MSVLQICLLSIIGVLAILSIVFTILFIVEITKKEKATVKKVSIKEVKEINKTIEKEEQVSVDEMLKNLEEQSAEEESVFEDKQEVVAEEKIEETAVEEVVEPVVEEKKEEVKEVVEEIVESDEEDEENDDDEDDDDMLSYQKVDHVAILAPGTVIDYKARLEKVIAGKAKLERDLAKVEKFILKYERTDRRKARNEKMLDRRAGELTNLNLVMYSVTDIKNVDEDKKVKQEELTAHIAELKASIQDAEEYLESNREKYNHNVKMAKFLSQENVRYAEEIVELEALIKAADENK